MKLLDILWICIAVIAIASGCAAKTSVYQGWGKELSNAVETNLKKGDVSLMLGTEPYKCENISANPMIGILLKDELGATVSGIDPKGAAVNTGIKIGDKIISVNSTITKSAKEVVDSIRVFAHPDRPITIQTKNGVYDLVPKYPTETKQCYWEVTAGKIGKIAGSAYVNQYGGTAVQNGAEYQRFFRATCRFTDGRVYVCQSNWQE